MECCPDKYAVKDTRAKKCFKKETFSGYKKSKVFSELKKCMLASKLERACHWVCELDISGYQPLIWKKLIQFYCEHVSVANIRLFVLLARRHQTYIIQRDLLQDHKDLRNVQTHRNHLSEIVSLLTLSRKMNVPKKVKIQKNEFILSNISHRFKAKSQTIIKGIIQKHDPEELHIPANEIAWMLRMNNHSQESQDACLFWLPA